MFTFVCTLSVKAQVTISSESKKVQIKNYLNSLMYRKKNQNLINQRVYRNDDRDFRVVTFFDKAKNQHNAS